MVRRILPLWWCNLVMLLAGCAAAWKPMSTPLLTDPPGDRAFKIWTAERTYALSDLRLTSDSISGIPLIESRSCRACRVFLAKSTIDSVRAGDPVSGTALTFAVAGVAVVGFILLGLGAYVLGVFGQD